jgi:hypothetical protein
VAGKSNPHGQRMSYHLSPDTRHFYERHIEQDDCAGAEPQLASDQLSHAPIAVGVNINAQLDALGFDGVFVLWY